MDGRSIAYLTAALVSATIPSMSIAQSGERCAAERGLYAERGGAGRAWITIVNQAQYPVRVFWINFDGARVPYKVLRTGQNFRSYSYSSHPWVVTDLAGNCRQVFFTEIDDRTYVFNAPGSARRYEPEPYDGPDSVEPLTERDAGREIDVQVGQEMTIALRSNTSTGYHWEPTFPRNVSVLGPVTQERPPYALIGGGGTSLVRFLVPRPGRAEITLMHLPPGGGNAQRTLTFRFRGI